MATLVAEDETGTVSDVPAKTLPIVPRRFGIKYSPRPTIALEYSPPAGRKQGLQLLEIPFDRLTPRVYDVDGVVAALQTTFPQHFGPNVVSVSQLNRLVSRVLLKSAAHSPPPASATEPKSSTPDPPSSTSPIHGSPSRPRPSSPRLEERLQGEKDGRSEEPPSISKPCLLPRFLGLSKGEHGDEIPSSKLQGSQDDPEHESSRTASPERSTGGGFSGLEPSEGGEGLDRSGLDSPSGADKNTTAMLLAREPTPSQPLVLGRTTKSTEDAAEDAMRTHPDTPECSALLDEEGPRTSAPHFGNRDDLGDETPEEDDIPEDIEEEAVEDGRGEDVALSPVCRAVESDSELSLGSKMRSTPAHAAAVAADGDDSLRLHPRPSFSPGEIEHEVSEDVAVLRQSFASPLGTGGKNGSETKQDMLSGSDSVISGEEVHTEGRMKHEAGLGKPPRPPTLPFPSDAIRPRSPTSLLPVPHPPPSLGGANTPSLAEVPLPPLSRLRTKGLHPSTMPPVGERNSRPAFGEHVRDENDDKTPSGGAPPAQSAPTVPRPGEPTEHVDNDVTEVTKPSFVLADRDRMGRAVYTTTPDDKDEFPDEEGNFGSVTRTVRFGLTNQIESKCNTPRDTGGEDEFPPESPRQHGKDRQKGKDDLEEHPAAEGPGDAANQDPRESDGVNGAGDLVDLCEADDLLAEESSIEEEISFDREDDEGDEQSGNNSEDYFA